MMTVAAAEQSKPVVLAVPSLTVDDMLARIYAYNGAVTGDTPGQALRRYIRYALWGDLVGVDAPLIQGEREALGRLFNVDGSTVFRMRGLGFDAAEGYAVGLGLAIESVPPTIDEPFTIKPGRWIKPEAITERVRLVASTTSPTPESVFSLGDAFGTAGQSVPGLALHRALCTGAGFNPDAFGARAWCARLLGVSLRRYSQILGRDQIRPVLKHAHARGLAVQGSHMGWVVANDP